MKKLNWKKLPERAVLTNAKNLWQKAADSVVKVEISPEMIVELFAREDPRKKEEGEKKTESTKPKVISLLDQKASLNVNIFLKQFKTTNEAVVAIIQNGDTSSITAEQVKSLEKLLPEASILEMLREFTGERSLLGSAEDFYLRLGEVEQFPLRVSALQLRLEFSEKFGDIEPALMLLASAVQEILRSDVLDRLLYVVLMTGNHINGGTHGGGAFGFTLDSLGKLKDTKANKPRMTALHFIVSVCEEQEVGLLDIQQDLQHLEAAARLSLDYLSQQVNELEAQVNMLEKKMGSAPEDLQKQVMDFLVHAKSQVEHLKSMLADITRKSEEVADYYLLDKSKFKVEELLKEVLGFVKDLQEARKVSRLCICKYIASPYVVPLVTPIYTIIYTCIHKYVFNMHTYTHVCTLYIHTCIHAYV